MANHTRTGNRAHGDPPGWTMRGRRALSALALTCALMIVIGPTRSNAAPHPFVNTYCTANANTTNDTCYGNSALITEPADTHSSAFGFNALSLNTTGGNYNSAFGEEALFQNTTGTENTASGAGALASNTTGNDNTAAGLQALELNTTGIQNTATGHQALGANSTGGDNTATGRAALSANTTGGNNTALGYAAGVTANTANANTTGSFNTFLGYQAGPGTNAQLTNATAIGENALVSESNALVLGGTGADAANVGIGTQTPVSLLQVGVPSNAYGNYIQIPEVASNNAPPAADCNNTTFRGRLVLQDKGPKETLWACTTNGTWKKV